MDVACIKVPGLERASSSRQTGAPGQAHRGRRMGSVQATLRPPDNNEAGMADAIIPCVANSASAIGAHGEIASSKRNGRHIRYIRLTSSPYRHATRRNSAYLRPTVPLRDNRQNIWSSFI